MSEHEQLNSVTNLSEEQKDFLVSVYRMQGLNEPVYTREKIIQEQIDHFMGFCREPSEIQDFTFLDVIAELRQNTKEYFPDTLNDFDMMVYQFQNNDHELSEPER